MLTNSDNSNTSDNSSIVVTAAAICQALRLNNEGIYFLSLGDEKRAITAFSNAFESIEGSIRNQSDGEREVGGSDDNENNDRSSNPLVPRPPTFVYETSVTFSALRHDMDGYLFCHPLLLQAGSVWNRSGCDDELSSFLALSGAVILFNISLCSHQMSFTASSGGHGWLQRAMRLYQVTLQLLGVDDENDDPRYATSIRALRLLVLNNKAQIHNRECQFTEAASCVRDLSTMIVRHLDVIDQRSIDVDQILMNLFAFQPPRSAPAA